MSSDGSIVVWSDAPAPAGPPALLQAGWSIPALPRASLLCTKQASDGGLGDGGLGGMGDWALLPHAESQGHLEDLR